MPRLTEILDSIAWTDAELTSTRWREDLRAASVEDGDQALVAAFVSPGFEQVNFDAIDPAVPVRRFTADTEEELRASAAARASEFSNPFTSAVLLDYSAAGRKKSKEHRDATLAVANRYLDIVDHAARLNATRGHFLVITDAMARAVDLLGEYAIGPDRVATAAERLLPAIDPNAVGALATTLTRRLRKSATCLLPLYVKMRTIVESLPDNLKRAQCAYDLGRLAAFAGELGGHKLWAAEVIGNAALAREGAVAELVSAAELMSALRLATETGHAIRSDLLRALERLKPKLQEVGTWTQVLKFRVDKGDIARSSDHLAGRPDLVRKLVACSYITKMPTRSEHEKLAVFLHVGETASLVTFVPIGGHGPTGDDPDSLADHHAMETLVQVRSQIVHSVFQGLDRALHLPGSDVAQEFQAAGLIELGQEPLLADAINAWAAGEYRLGLFALFPFVEQVFRSACGVGLGRGRHGGVLLRVGGSITQQVRESFGVMRAN